MAFHSSRFFSLLFLVPTNCISLSDPIAGSLALISGLILAPGVVGVVWCGGPFVSVPGRSLLPSLEEAHLLPGPISAPLELPAIPLEVTHQPQNSPQDLVSSFMAPTLFAHSAPPPVPFRKSTTQGRKKKIK